MAFLELALDPFPQGKEVGGRRQVRPHRVHLRTARCPRAFRRPALQVLTLELPLEGALIRLRIDVDGGGEPWGLAAEGKGSLDVALDVEAEPTRRRARLG